MSTAEFNSAIIDFCPKLKIFALKLTKSLEDAEELIQETMYRALVNREKFRVGTNLKAWLYTIMKNIFINNYRKKSKRKTIMDSTDNNYFINSGAEKSLTSNGADQKFLMDDINKALNRLSDDYKLPFQMHYEGFKYQEIADEMALPLGTVKSRIFFARKNLQSQLTTYRMA